MTQRQQIEETAEALLAPIAKARGVRIYDVEYVKEGQDYYLRAYIDKDGGVTIDDCVDVSHDLSDALDREDPIAGAYTLEVSSPGLGRRLTKDRHFLASLGEEVEGTTFKPWDEGNQKAFEGVLLAFDKETITIGRYKESPSADEVRQAEDEDAPKTQEKLVLSRRNVARIRLKLDF